MTTDQAAPLEVHDLSVAYGKKTILNGVSLTIRPGEAMGLIGLNGAGKTTMIRAILDLNTTKCDIRIFGIPNKQTASRSKLVYLPEKFTPAVQLTGWEHLDIVLAHFDTQLDRQKAAALAAELDLAPDALDRRVATYSKGMGQKLGLVGALLAPPPLLILDEPMSGLDPRARVALKERLLVERAAGRTIFFSSHILADIEEVCDRIALLHNGQLSHVGPPSELLAATGAENLERAFLKAIGPAESVA